MSVAAASAIALLKDPEIREQLVRAGSGAVQQAREWNNTRRSGPGGPGSVTVVSPDGRTAGNRLRVVIPAVEQRRLEKRTTRLADTVAQLRSATGPRVATTFDEMDAAIERIRLALSVARNLPRSQRIESLDEVAEVLGGMETAVKDALLGGLTD